jgi:hypothetical protein
MLSLREGPQKNRNKGNRKKLLEKNSLRKFKSEKRPGSGSGI